MSRRALLPVALVLALSACTPQATEPTPSPSHSSASSTPTPSATPTGAAPGSAEAELAAFDSTNASTIAAADGHPKGRAFIDGLVAAGFEKGAMQLTPDKTAIGLDADSIQFSVKIDEDCLVGQFGSGGYHSVVLPAIDAAGCLIGKTRPINW